MFNLMAKIRPHIGTAQVLHINPSAYVLITRGPLWLRSVSTDFFYPEPLGLSGN
jgi:hypothetical protein